MLMSGEIPIESRAHVIVSYDRDFIKGLEDIPLGTDKVYYRNLALKCPERLSLYDFAQKIAKAEDPNIVENLGAERVQVFTTEQEDALTGVRYQLTDFFVLVPGPFICLRRDFNNRRFPEIPRPSVRRNLATALSTERLASVAQFGS